MYWPSRLMAMAVIILLEVSGALAFLFGSRVHGLRLALFGILVGCIVAAAQLFVVSRMLTRPYRAFTLCLVEPDSSSQLPLTPGRRAGLWLFLLWRQLVAWLLAAPLSLAIGLFLRQFDINAGDWLMVAAEPLIIGPVLVKMLVGHQFADFHLEARILPR
jgi:hypothetical protein